MDKGIKTIIRNILVLFAIDFIAFPAGVALYLLHGFHVTHIVVVVAYLFGLVLTYDTAVLLKKHIRLVTEREMDEVYEDLNYPGEDIEYSEEDQNYSDEEETSEELKPEMKAAMNKVFNLKK